jgi:hypothetical protein
VASICGGKDVNDEVELDSEWVELIQQALELGLTVEEIRNFLEQNIISNNACVHN